jgi:uncharacterized membrane protein YqjE
MATTSNGIDLRPEPDDPTEPIEADRSLGELISRMTSDVSALVSTQIELAKVEIKEEVTRAGKGAGMVGGAAIAGLLALLLLSFAAAWGLAEVVDAGWAFLIVGLVYAAVAGVLFLRGRDQIRSATPVVPETKETLKEDVEWARQQRS